MTKPTKKDGVSLLAEAISQAGKDIGNLSNIKEAVLAQGQVLTENNQLLKTLVQREPAPKETAGQGASTLSPELTTIVQEMTQLRDIAKQNARFSNEQQYISDQLFRLFQQVEGQSKVPNVAFYAEVEIQGGDPSRGYNETFDIPLPPELFGKQGYAFFVDKKEWKQLNRTALSLTESLSVPIYSFDNRFKVLVIAEMPMAPQHIQVKAKVTDTWVKK